MAEPIKPALTPDEWEHQEFAIGGKREDTLFGYVHSEDGSLRIGWNGEPMRPVKDRRAFAALALHDQPFGFTWEDVDALRAASGVFDDAYGEFVHLSDIADRIAALLPPRQ